MAFDFGKILEDAKKGVEDFGNAVGEAAEETGKAIGEGAENAGHAVEEAAEATVNTASDIANEAGKAIVEGAENAGHAIGEAVEETSKAIVEGAENAGEAISNVIHDIKVNIYHPLFPDDYWSEDFHKPKLIAIVDEDIRKGIDVCEGAIGWIEKGCKPEIMCLYDEFINDCGLRFSPYHMCGNAYYRHPFENDLYIHVNEYIKICRENQLTELKNIAYSLGASSCSVEVYEHRFKSTSINGDIDRKVQAQDKTVKASRKESLKGKLDTSKKNSFSILMQESFNSKRDAVQPELLWFKNDKEIQSLVNKCCNESGSKDLNEYSMDISSSASSSISVNLAGKIDSSLKTIGLAANDSYGFSLQTQIASEEEKRLIYKIKF